MSNFLFGSDQIWRYGFNLNSFDSYFASFVENGKNIFSYAASFGEDNAKAFPDDIIKNMSVSLARFSGISVREESGVKICSETLNAKALRVLDPVLMLDSCDFDEIIDSEPHEPKNKPYIAIHEINRSSFFSDCSRKIAKIIGMDIVRIEENKGNYRQASMSQWLYKIRNADFVLTDSYHCTIMSIIFRKPFLCILSSQKTGSRFETLLSETGFSDKMLTRENYESFNYSAIKDFNYESALKLLENKKEISRNFIKSMLP